MPIVSTRNTGTVELVSSEFCMICRSPPRARRVKPIQQGCDVPRALEQFPGLHRSVEAIDESVGDRRILCGGLQQAYQVGRWWLEHEVAPLRHRLGICPDALDRALTEGLVGAELVADRLAQVPRGVRGGVRALRRKR